MKRNGGKKLLFFAMVLGMFFSFRVTASAADKVTLPERAVRSGNNIYWALGNDGSGPVKCYNVSTKKTNTVIKLNCTHLSVKGSYLYFTVDKYSGSDARDHYIYSAKKNGNGLKKLANGRFPVIVGNYIYYIQTKKGKPFGVTIDTGTAGIYRMNLNGTGKKCIYKAAANESLGNLCKVNDKLLFMSGGKWYSISVSGKNKTSYTWSFGKQNCNANVNSFSLYPNTKWPVMKNKVSANSSGDAFAGSGSSVVRTTKTGAKKTIKTFKGETIQKIIDLNGYLFVIAHGKIKSPYSNTMVEGAYVYVMKSNGSGAKKLTSFILAGGGW